MGEALCDLCRSLEIATAKKPLDDLVDINGNKYQPKPLPQPERQLRKPEPTVSRERFAWPKKKPIGHVRRVNGVVRREDVEHALRQDAETLDMLSELFGKAL